MTTTLYEPVLIETRGFVPPSVGRATLTLPRALLVFGVVVLGHSWFLGLPFQLDDYGLLGDPLSFFSATENRGGLTARMMRWPLVALLGLLRAIAPEPLSPALFHAVGLALHATTAVVLARCVSRFEAWLGLPGAAVLSGLLFGLGGGHVQAASWTAAWASMLYPLFGLLALDSFLGARAHGGGGRRRLTGGIWLFLALVSKAPAVIMLGALALFLFATAVFSRHGRLRDLWAEALTCTFFLAIAAACRYAVYGTLELSYYDRETPSVLEALAGIPRGLVALGQALVPWNVQPPFEGSEPLFVVLTGASWKGSLLAAVGFLPCLLLGIVLQRRVRAPLLLGIVTLLLCCIPPGLVSQGAGSNLIGRTTYLAMLVATSMLALSAAGIFARSHLVGSITALWMLALTIDGSVHVAATERLAGEFRADGIALVRELEAEHAAGGSDAELAVLVVGDEPGLGQIPCFGPRIVEALRPPFYEAPGVLAYPFADAREMVERSAELDLAYHEVAVVGPALAAGGTPVPIGPDDGGATVRAQRAWRRLSSGFTGYTPAPGSPETFVAVGADGRRWTTLHPIQPHLARTLHFALDPRAVSAAQGGRAVLDGTLHVERVEGGELEFPIRVPLGPTGTVTFELPLTPEDFCGPAWTGLRWTFGESGLLPRSVTTRASLPRLEFLGAQDASELSIRAGRIPRPRLLFSVSEEATPSRSARLTWSFATRGGPRRLFAEAGVVIRDGSFGFSPKRVHVEGSAREEFPWGEFCRRYLVPYAEQTGGGALELECRLALLLSDGQVTARSGPFVLRFEG